jgi:hypothetical protein
MRLESRVNRIESQIANLQAPTAPVESVKRWAKDISGFNLDRWQHDLLVDDWRRCLLNITRQGGKSTASALLALHTAEYKAPALVLMVSPSLRQSSELFRKASSIYRGPVVNQSSLYMELTNGSRIVSLPGSEKTIRGFSAVDLLIVDEAARVDDALYRSIRPMLAVSGGRLLALSTPWGRRGWFYNAWESDSWTKVKVTAAQCDRISAEFLAEERRELGERWYRQEYFCEFTARAGQLFDDDVIMQAGEVQAWQL